MMDKGFCNGKTNLSTWIILIITFHIQQISMNATVPMVAVHMHAITLLEVTSAPVELVISLMWVVQNAHVSLSAVIIL